MRESESRQSNPLRFWAWMGCHAWFMTLLITGCAHVEAPPGGPVDKIPPYVIGVYPAPQQTEVTRDAAIRLKFSEWVQSEALKNQVALSPILPGKIRLEPEGDELLIQHDSLFRENTTYRMVIPTALKDMNGVALDSAFELIFSTGKGIDSGHVEGEVFQVPPANLKQAWVALYSHSREGLVARRGERRRPNWPDSSMNAWREKPTYLTSVDSTGAFRFEALPPGRYGVLGFQDANQNQLPDNGEALAIGPAGVLIGTMPPPRLSMRMSIQDTQKLRLTKVTWLPAGDSSGGWIAGALKVSMSRLPTWNKAGLVDAFMVSPADPHSPQAALRRQPESIGLSPEGELELWFSRLPFGERLLLRAFNLTDDQGIPLDTSRASLTFDALGGATASQANPMKWTLWNTDPITRTPQPIAKDAQALFSSILVRCEKPITDSLLNTLQAEWQLKNDSMPLAFQSKREGPFGIRLTWSLPKKAGKSFVLNLIPRSDSNPSIDSLSNLGDSSKAEITAQKMAQKKVPVPIGKWSVLDSASWSTLKLKADSHWLGWTGILRRQSSDEWRKIRFNSEKEVRVDSLTPGIWRLSVFADQNGNGWWNSGSLLPWQSQEPTSYWSDTLSLIAGKVLGPVPVGPKNP